MINKHSSRVIPLFKQYLISGWSARSFAKHLYGGQRSYDWLLQNNKEFSALNDEFKTRSMKRLHFEREARA